METLPFLRVQEEGHTVSPQLLCLSYRTVSKSRRWRQFGYLINLSSSDIECLWKILDKLAISNMGIMFLIIVS